MDRIEVQITGRSGDVPISKVIEESASLLADGLKAVFAPDPDDGNLDKDESSDEDTQVGEFFCAESTTRFSF